MFQILEPEPAPVAALVTGASFVGGRKVEMRVATEGVPPHYATRMIRRPFARRFASLALVLGMTPALLLPAGGCSLFRPAEQAVAVTSSDPQTRILLGNDLMGTGSATLNLRRNRHYRVTAEFADGTTRTVRLSPQVSTTGILDIIGGILFLVPFVGAFSPGFYDLKPTSIRFEPVAAADRSDAPATRPATSDDAARLVPVE